MDRALSDERGETESRVSRCGRSKRSRAQVLIQARTLQARTQSVPTHTTSRPAEAAGSSREQQGQWYRVIWRGGAIIRKSLDLRSPLVNIVEKDTRILVAHVHERRAYVVAPIVGWVSLWTKAGLQIAKPDTGQNTPRNAEAGPNPPVRPRPIDIQGRAGPSPSSSVGSGPASTAQPGRTPNAPSTVPPAIPVTVTFSGPDRRRASTIVGIAPTAGADDGLLSDLLSSLRERSEFLLGTPVTGTSEELLLSDDEQFELEQDLGDTAEAAPVSPKDLAPGVPRSSLDGTPPHAIAGSREKSAKAPTQAKRKPISHSPSSSKGPSPTQRRATAASLRRRPMTPPPKQEWSDPLAEIKIIEDHFAAPKYRPRNSAGDDGDGGDDTDLPLEPRPLACTRYCLGNNYGFPLDATLNAAIFASSERVQTPGARLWRSMTELWASKNWNPHTRGAPPTRRIAFWSARKGDAKDMAPEAGQHGALSGRESRVSSTGSAGVRGARMSTTRRSTDSLGSVRDGLVGIASGFSGVFSDPVRGAFDDGVEGFFNGLGTGLAGLIAKPRKSLGKLFARSPAVAHQHITRLVLKGRLPDHMRSAIWSAATAAGQLRALYGGAYFHDKVAECKTMIEVGSADTAAAEQPEVKKQLQVIKGIAKDLGRTFPKHSFFSRDADGAGRLRVLLCAFSRHRTDIGYCQCLNYIGAALLLVCEPEAAFWNLVALSDYVLPKDYFSYNLLGAVADTRVLHVLATKRVPAVMRHVRRLDAHLATSCLQWFVCMYVNVLPFHTALRVWDMTLIIGRHVLFWAALAILHLYEDQILATKDEGQLLDVMTRAGAVMVDEEAFVKAMKKFKISRSSVRKLHDMELRALRPRVETRTAQDGKQRGRYRQSRSRVASRTADGPKRQAPARSTAALKRQPAPKASVGALGLRPKR